MADLGTKTAFLLELALALRLAGTYAPGTSPSTEVIGDLRNILEAMARSGDTHLDIVVDATGITVNDSGFPFYQGGVSGLWEHLHERRVGRVTMPVRISADELWKFLVIVGGSTERVSASPAQALSAAGCKEIAVQNASAEPADDDANPWADVDNFGDPSKTWKLEDLSDDHDLTEVETLDEEPSAPGGPATPWESSAQEVADDDPLYSGDTVQASFTPEKLTVVDRITREVVRQHRPEGADAAAGAILEAWKRLIPFQSPDADAPILNEAANAITRLDPALRTAVVFALANGTQAQRQICQKLGPQYIAEALMEGLLAPIGGFVARAPAVLQAVQQRPLRGKIMDSVARIATKLGPERRAMWDNVRRRSL